MMSGQKAVRCLIRMSEKGGSLHDGCGGSGEHLALLCLQMSYKMQDKEAIVTVLTVSAVVAVSGMTATPLNSTAVFRHPDLNPSRTKIAQSQSLAISALTEPNRQRSRRKKGFWAQKTQPRRKKGFWAQKSQPEIANR